MGLFDFINDILYKKHGNCLDKKENESELNPYMMQRWLSMHSKDNVRILNATTNSVHNGVADKQQWYKLFLGVLPKCKFKRFRYIKKTKTPPTKATGEDAAIKMIAKFHKMSEREVRMYVEDYGLDISNIMKSIKEK